MTGAYCSCDLGKRDWLGIANVLVAKPDKWTDIARYYAGLVICQACGKIAAWRGEPVGQIGLSGAAHILKTIWGSDGD